MKIFAAFPENYELIDAGNEFKLERWGDVITIRPEHQAYFKPGLPKSTWYEKAHWEFIPNSAGSLNGTWKKLKEDAPQQWDIRINGLLFSLEVTSNKHIGLFPEQHENWEFICKKLDENKRFLNAFAYTGAASCFGAMEGAEVIHCDSVKGMIDWAKINAELSNIYSIKWVLEDAFKFINREVKRGNKYDLVQLDPPAWGMGANKEKWKLEKDLPSLVSASIELLNKNGTLILNTYSPKMGLEKIDGILKELGKSFTYTNQELWMKSTTGKSLYFGVLTRITRLSPR
jgi:23S rRNA (cytosine1962-C5)-methyltransferase